MVQSTPPPQGPAFQPQKRYNLLEVMAERLGIPERRKSIKPSESKESKIPEWAKDLGKFFAKAALRTATLGLVVIASTVLMLPSVAGLYIAAKGEAEQEKAKSEGIELTLFDKRAPRTMAGQILCLPWVGAVKAFQAAARLKFAPGGAFDKAAKGIKEYNVLEALYAEAARREGKGKPMSRASIERFIAELERYG